MQNKLTVCLITYNHRKYIREAIDSIFSQKTTFGWNVHIYDDHSTDGTTDILREYQQQYPDKITLIIQPQNVGAAENWRQLLQSASAPYIAYLEGDDYWIDVHKLEKQYAVLEKNLSVGLVYTQARQVYPGDFETKVIGKSLARHALYLGNPIPSPTVVYRKICLDGFFNKLGDRLEYWKMGDYPLWFWISSSWSLVFIEEPMSAYRVLQNSATRSSDKREWIQSKLNIQHYFYRNNGSLNALPYYLIGVTILQLELIYHYFRRLRHKITVDK
jgi:glycosyltransferase involved in cell wall biosynthesis